MFPRAATFIMHVPVQVDCGSFSVALAICGQGGGISPRWGMIFLRRRLCSGDPARMPLMCALIGVGVQSGWGEYSRAG